jgi:FAD/FMN-containing dehydrogenase
VVAEFQRAGMWTVPHPWIDVIVPAGRAEAFIAAELAALQRADLGGGLVLLTPLARSRLRAPLCRVPDAEQLLLFDVLRNAVPGTPARAADLARDNRALYERALAIGATLYPISAVELTPDDWRRHYGERWPEVVAAKRRFDPEHRLGRGLRITDGTAPT